MRDPKTIRNIAFVGHGHTGKTTLVSAVLFYTGKTNRFLKVDQGNTITDFDPEEIERKITISTAVAFTDFEGHRINLIDTPGFPNFFWETEAALYAADAGVVMVDAASGVEVQTERAWEILDRLGLPRLVVVNKLDRENTDFFSALESLKESFGRKIVPIALPLGKEKDFKGIVDLVKGKAYIYKADESGQWEESEVPADLQESYEKWRSEMVEMVAESDEELMEKYLEDALSQEDLAGGLRNSVMAGEIYPVLPASAALNIGTWNLLSAVVELLPSPAERPPIRVEDLEIKPDVDEPLATLVFKTLSDPFAGRISIMRVFSGRLTPDTVVLNANRETEEKISNIFYLMGKEHVSAEEAVAGEIVATAKLKNTFTGDTLCSKDRPMKLPFPPLYEPTISFAIEPKTKKDEDKISNALHKLHEEDPSFKAERDSETKELILSGNGQLHVEVLISKLKKQYGVEVLLKTPKIPYRETIKGTADVQGKYKKQTGGRGQYGDVKIKMEPLPRGEDFEFVDQIFGGAIPKNFIPAVEKGIQEARKKGVLAGYPTVDFRVILYDGSYHPVDSSDLAFQIAASMAFKKGAKMAKPTLLEPIMKVEVIVPEQYMGDVMGNLNGRRGRILGTEMRGKKAVIKAYVPMAEMLTFEPDLTSITGGRGTYRMEFSHYDEVPPHLQEKIIEQAKAEGRISAEEE